MGLFDIFKKKPAASKTSEKIALPKEVIDAVRERLVSGTERPYIKITTAVKDAGLTESKFGGYPYWEEGKAYPVDKHGEKLALLAQINLADVPKSSLPETGILQFYIALDDLMGLDFDGDTSGYKVIYFPQIKEPLSIERLKELGITAFCDCDEKMAYPPFRKTYALAFENATDWAWDFTSEEIVEAIKEIAGIEIDPRALYRTLSRETFNALFASLENAGHKMFGYANFTQTDPRTSEDEYPVLLLQIDSEFGKGSDKEIMWGDAGIANFFISEDDLKNRNFDDILYNWDCG